MRSERGQTRQADKRARARTFGFESAFRRAAAAWCPTCRRRSASSSTRDGLRTPSAVSAPRSAQAQRRGRAPSSRARSALLPPTRCFTPGVKSSSVIASPARQASRQAAAAPNQSDGGRAAAACAPMVTMSAPALTLLPCSPCGDLESPRRSTSSARTLSSAGLQNDCTSSASILTLHGVARRSGRRTDAALRSLLTLAPIQSWPSSPRRPRRPQAAFRRPCAAPRACWRPWRDSSTRSCRRPSPSSPPRTARRLRP